MALHREERYVITLPRDDGLLMGRYGTIEPNVQLFPFANPNENENENEHADAATFEAGYVKQWDPIHAHWKHHFLHSLAISQQKGDHPVLLLTPATFSKTDEQLAAKFWFEECNVPGLAMCPAAVAALLGANVTTGIVVDVGYRHTEIVPVSECSVLRTDQVIVPYGMLDAVADLRANPPTADLSPAHAQVLKALLQLSDHQLATGFHGLWSSSYAASIPDYTLTVPADKVSPQLLKAATDAAAALAEAKAAEAPASRKREKQQQQQQQPITQDQPQSSTSPAGSAPTSPTVHKSPTVGSPVTLTAPTLGAPAVAAAAVTITDAQGTLRLAIPGAVRQLLAPYLTTPLIDGLVRALDSLATTDAVLRPTLADNLVLTGLGSIMIDCLADRIEVEAARLLVASQSSAESQPRGVAFRWMPTYLESYRGRHDWVGYLGGTLVSRSLFADARGFVTRDEYERLGPGVVHGKNYGGITL